MSTNLISAGGGADASVLSKTAAAFRAVLSGTAQSEKRPDADSVVAALLATEKATKQERSVIAPEALLGSWRLCFTTGVRKLRRGGIALGKGFYIPRLFPAHIGFSGVDEASAVGTITNQIQLGGLRIKFSGPCRYQTKKNLLVFDFTDLQVALFGKTLYQSKVRSGRTGTPFEQQAIAKLPFFAFFWASAEGIAARGRGGGLALWVREPG